MRFTDQVCLVTGGGSGIGRATCRRLAAEGGRVVVADVSEEGGAETARLIGTDGGEAVFVKVDVAVAAEVRAAVDAAVARWGRIDVLVNNAAVMTFKPVVELGEDEWDRVLAVNLRAVFLFCKYSLPHMRRGAIVNVSSIHAHETDANLSPYAASKGGVEAFTRALSRECEHVRVNCVAPGGVNTPLLWENPVIKRMRREDVVYAEPEQIASAICFLASDEAGAVDGATLMTDLGLLSKI